MKKIFLSFSVALIIAFVFNSCEDEEVLTSEEWLQRQGIPISEASVMNAVNSGDAHILKHLISADKSNFLDSAFDKLVSQDKYEKALFMVKCGYRAYFSTYDLMTAIKNNDLRHCAFLICCGVNINKESDSFGYYGKTPLLLAINEKRLKIVQMLIEAGAEPNGEYRNAFEAAVRVGDPEIIRYLSKVPGIDKCGITKLSIAVLENDISTVERLCKNKKNINKSDKEGKTPLYWACDKLRPECVRLLLKAGAKVNKADKHGHTPLMCVVAESPAIVKMLLEAGADVNQESGVGNTALHIAAVRGQSESVALLIEAGANVNHVNRDGESPVDLAMERNHHECVKLMNAGGGNIGVVTSDNLCDVIRKGDVEALRVLLEANADVNVHSLSICLLGVSCEDGSPLHLAAYYGQPECLKVLIAAGADLNYGIGQHAVITPLVCAISSQENRKKSAECAKILIEAGANVNNQSSGKHRYSPAVLATIRSDRPEILKMLISARAEIRRGNYYDASPLYLAAEYGRLECMKLLLTEGVDAGVGIIDVFNKQIPPLYISAYNGHADCLKLLIDAGADVNFVNTSKERGDSVNYTALFVAARNGHAQCVEYLLDGGADINQIVYKETPLCIAAKKGHSECVKLLITRGADVNLCGDYGNTPICAAAENGHVDCVKLLIAAGADLNKSTGYTAFSRAKKNGHEQCAELIRKAGGRAK